MFKNNLFNANYRPSNIRSLHTVLPGLACMRTIKLISYSGFVLTERAHYSRVRTIQLFIYWSINQIYFSPVFDLKNPILSNFLRFVTFLSRETLIWNSYNTDKSYLPSQNRSKSWYGRTNWEGALLHYSCSTGSCYSGERTNQGGRSNRGSTVQVFFCYSV